MTFYGWPDDEQEALQTAHEQGDHFGNPDPDCWCCWDQEDEDEDNPECPGDFE